ncbi:uncharacterized protein N7518_006793 [Penicillium psychrosexuale]|uniref:uncharacterized protein n=1 Tax=Penicillium psychrosexuale TaxID=1002107 RepID=UPI00254509E6|nr:uncharacterized protein N7518_006793 [Penicillium psychrosexuale]KAJ5789782.1 hypothetical protein N7518_006793 [Penicillium psychrosexuale]
MKGNAVLYEAIAEVWRADTGQKISHQTVHKHITDRLKEHSAILAIPEPDRAKLNATEAAMFDYANEIYEVLQENAVAEQRRRDLTARADTKAQAGTDSVRDDTADELVQPAREKRPRDPVDSREEGMQQLACLSANSPAASPAANPTSLAIAFLTIAYLTITANRNGSIS